MFKDSFRKMRSSVTVLIAAFILLACKEGSNGILELRVESPLSLQVSDIQITEGSLGSSTTPAAFTVSLSASSSNIVTVDYATADLTAVAPDDYQSKSGRLSFAPGEIRKTVTIDVFTDDIVEPDEIFTLVLSNPGNAQLYKATGIATIANDDISIPVLPMLQVADINVTEGDSGTTLAVFTTSLSVSSSNTVTVNYATADMTATAPSDYQSENGVLSFAPGETRKMVMVNVVADGSVEPDETFSLTLSNPINADLKDAVAVATIRNDDIDSTVLLSNPGPQSFNEEQEYTIDITARASARIFVSGMPPGMHWDEVNRRFDFRPDFIQGGKTWQVTMEAVDGAENDIQIFTVTVNNTIQPPWPEIVSSEEIGGLTQATGIIKLGVLQTTDDFLDSPGYAGRTFNANLAVPMQASATNQMPVRIGLHGSGGSPGTEGRGWIFGIAAHDPHTPRETWWTGYNDQLPNGAITSGSTNPNYTQRRVMHLLSYLLESCPGREGGCPGADPTRISVSGQSMGGTGSFFLAVNYSRHFTGLNSRIGGTTPYFLSPDQQATLTALWGSKDLGLPSDRGINVWDQYDASRAIFHDKDFRNLHFSTISGKNDPTINFKAMVGISPVTGYSFLGALQKEGVGHFIIWDQRAHGSLARWWEPLDEYSFLRRNLAFPAFSNGSADDDAGEPDGMGGFTGASQGALNQHLRWDSANIIDTRDKLSMPIKANIDLPMTADVTIRRIQQFQLLPGETINWSYNGASGIVSANEDGSVTVQGLAMTIDFVPLVLTRP